MMQWLGVGSKPTRPGSGLSQSPGAVRGVPGREAPAVGAAVSLAARARLTEGLPAWTRVSCAGKAPALQLLHVGGGAGGE